MKFEVLGELTLGFYKSRGRRSVDFTIHKDFNKLPTDKQTLLRQIVLFVMSITSYRYFSILHMMIHFSHVCVHWHASLHRG